MVKMQPVIDIHDPDISKAIKDLFWAHGVMRELGNDSYFELSANDDVFDEDDYLKSEYDSRARAAWNHNQVPYIDAVNQLRTWFTENVGDQSLIVKFWW